MLKLKHPYILLGKVTRMTISSAVRLQILDYFILYVLYNQPTESVHSSRLPRVLGSLLLVSMYCSMNSMHVVANQLSSIKLTLQCLFDDLLLILDR